MFWTRGALVLPVAETWAFVPQVEYRVGIQKRF